MGYDTSYNLHVCGVSGDEEEQIYREIADAAGEPFENVKSFGFTGRWYDSDDDLKRIAARHPEAIIEVSGNGEAPDDIWCARYKGRRCETVRYDGLPAFREILTPEEEIVAFYNDYRAFIAARERVVRTAVTHIRTVKARICGRKDCHLYLEPINDVMPLCSVEGHTPITDTAFRSLVTGISDDGETVTTDGDPIDLADMDPESVHNVVLMLEVLEKDIKEGLCKGRYDEDDGWFIIEPAAA